MITVFQEITNWEFAPNTPNGIYHLNDHGHLVAYKPPGGELKTLSQPIKKFDKRGRKFEKLDSYAEAADDNIIKVKGSKGKEYIIRDGKCNCPGATFRGTCKHMTERGL